jgi:TolB-like protein
MISEQISSRMAQHGFKVLEMKLRQNSIYIKEGEGEFLLSRQLKEISASHNGDLVIVGTYAVAEKTIYISARIVNAADSTIVTGYDYQLKRNFQIESML